jgi:hypothetical protein
MVFSISPAVTITEQDLTNIIPAVASTPGAFAGTFRWGPVLERTLVDSENTLARIFGKPTDNTYQSFFTAANFLAYGGALNVVRNVGVNAANASSIPTASFNGTGSQTTFTLPFTPNSKNVLTVIVGGVTLASTAYNLAGAVLTFTSAPASGTNNVKVGEKQVIGNTTQFGTLSGLVSSIYAKYPGTGGNSFRVILCDSTSYASLSSGDKLLFTSVPDAGTVHYAVIDADGKFTGVSGTILERKQFLSTTAGTLAADGTTNYYKDWINRNSLYCWSTGTTTDFSAGSMTLINGINDNVATPSLLQAGFALFATASDVDVGLVMTGAADVATAIYVLNNVSASRLDCVTFVSPLLSDVVGAPGQELTNVATTVGSLPSTSYGFMDCNWKLQYDRYNDIDRWVPLNGDIAGLCTRTDMIADPWWSPAGYNRGQIKNVIKLAWNPSKPQRDALYNLSVNPVISEAGNGTFLFGDKTLLNRPSAFSRINVRRLFIVMEKSIATAAKYALFEFNDSFTQGQFRNQVNPFLRDIQGRRGVTGFQVVCDETNNTAQVIDNEEFVGTIIVKPNRAINAIQLNFVAVGSDVQFTEIGG